MDYREKQSIEYEIERDEDMSFLEKGIAFNLMALAEEKGDDYEMGLDESVLKDMAIRIADNDEFREVYSKLMNEEIEYHAEEYFSEEFEI